MPAWSQDGGNAQRTGYIAQEPTAPWSVLWSWNGADRDGGLGGHLYTAPHEGRPVAASTLLFVPAGESGLYALELATGAVRWHLVGHPIVASPAYDATSDTVLAGSTDGNLIKITAETGAVVSRVFCSAPIRKAVLVQGTAAYVVTELGVLKKITISTMAVAWTHTPTGTPGRATTPPAYSPSRARVVYTTNDLYVHAVTDSTGASAWRVKPSPNTAADPNTFEGGWPVIAESHGFVLLRMQLDHAYLSDYPSGAGNVFPSGTAAVAGGTIRTYLDANPSHKNLFVLDLDDGTEAFTAAVGYGSVEGLRSGSAYGVLGSMPVIKDWAGTEVAYIQYRNGAGDPPDYRWDGHMGEMVLDASAVSGLVAGDCRFVRMSKYYTTGVAVVKGISNCAIVDEQCPLTMAGTSLFHAHWGASEGIVIVDRTAARGLVVTDPITSTDHLPVLRETVASTFNLTTRYATNSALTMVSDTRSWTGPGYSQYKSVIAPPGPVAVNAYSAGLRARSTFATDGYLIVTGNGGDILCFKHQGASAVGAATGLTISGPLSGMSGSLSRRFTVRLHPLGATATGTVTVTPSDSGGGGTFTPTTLSLLSASPAGTFQYTPGSTGVKTISVTNNGSLANPTSLTYTAR